MHFLMDTGNLKRYFKIHDVFAAFVANAMHDYEHP
jgi:hypothetical protein